MYYKNLSFYNQYFLVIRRVLLPFPLKVGSETLSVGFLIGSVYEKSSLTIIEEHF